MLVLTGCGEQFYGEKLLTWSRFCGGMGGDGGLGVLLGREGRHTGTLGSGAGMQDFTVRCPPLCCLHQAYF